MKNQQDERQTIDVMALLNRTIKILCERHTPYTRFSENPFFGSSYKRVEGTCLIRYQKTRNGFGVMLSTMASDGSPKGDAYRAWLSCFPYIEARDKQGEPRIECKVGWRSDGYGEIISDCSFLTAHSDHGLLFCGEIADMSVWQVLPKALSEMCAVLHQAVPTRGGRLGGLFHFVPARYFSDAPEKLADSIEKIIDLEMTKHYSSKER